MLHMSKNVQGVFRNEQLRHNERRLLEALPKSKGIGDVAAKLGMHRNSVKQILKRPRVISAIEQAFKKAGVTNLKIAHVFKDGLEANKVISANVIAKNGEGMADANSMTKDFIEVPDHPTRLKAAVEVSKLKRFYPDSDNLSLSGGIGNVKIEIKFVEAEAEIDITPEGQDVICV